MQGTATFGRLLKDFSKTQEWKVEAWFKTRKKIDERNSLKAKTHSEERALGCDTQLGTLI